MKICLESFLIYTVSHKKCATFIWTIAPVFFVGFFTLLVPMETGMNTLQKSYKIYKCTLTLSPHYLIKLKPHKTAHFEISCHSILLLNSKNEFMS